MEFLQEETKENFVGTIRRIYEGQGGPHGDLSTVPTIEGIGQAFDANGTPAQFPAAHKRAGQTGSSNRLSLLPNRRRTFPGYSTVNSVVMP